MDSKDFKKAIDDADDILIKEIDIKDKKKGREIEIEEIRIKKKERQKENLDKIKKFLKKFWHLLWKDDSFKGWIFAVIFLFVFIKFIFFPILSLTTGTSLPLAIVESCSMYHQGNLFSSPETWWDNNEQKYSEFEINDTNFNEFQMKKGFNKGDILFVTRANPEKLEVGDIIIFNANYRNPIIHRIVKIEDDETGGKIFSTMGDNNPGQLDSEKKILEDQLVGKASFKLAPYAGWVKLIFFEWQKPKQERGLCS